MILSQTLKIALLFLFFQLSFLFLIAQQQGPPPPVKEEIVLGEMLLYRHGIIKQVTAFDTGMVFKQGPNINNRPNFIGVNKYRSIIQLVGEDNMLVLAKFTCAYMSDPKDMIDELTKMGNFTFIITRQPGVDWLKANIISSLRDHKAIDETKNFEWNRKGEFKFNPDDKTYVLTFTNSEAR